MYRLKYKKIELYYSSKYWSTWQIIMTSFNVCDDWTFRYKIFIAIVAVEYCFRILVICSWIRSFLNYFLLSFFFNLIFFIRSFKCYFLIQKAALLHSLSQFGVQECFLRISCWFWFISVYFILCFLLIFVFLLCCRAVLGLSWYFNSFCSECLKFLLIIWKICFTDYVFIKYYYSQRLNQSYFQNTYDLV